MILTTVIKLCCARGQKAAKFKSFLIKISRSIRGTFVFWKCSLWQWRQGTDGMHSEHTAQNRKGEGWEGKGGSFTPATAIFPWSFSRVKGIMWYESEQAPWEWDPSRDQSHKGVGNSQPGQWLGANPAHQARWAIHMGYIPSLHTGKQPQFQQAGVGTSSPFPGQQAKPEPLPPHEREWLPGRSYITASCHSSCILPAMQKKGKSKLWKCIGDQNIVGHKTKMFWSAWHPAEPLCKMCNVQPSFSRNAIPLQSCNFAKVTSIKKFSIVFSSIHHKAPS